MCLVTTRCAISINSPPTQTLAQAKQLCLTFCAKVGLLESRLKLIKTRADLRYHLSAESNRQNRLKHLCIYSLITIALIVPYTMNDWWKFLPSLGLILILTRWKTRKLAKELGIPIVSPSQANRTGADKGILQAENAAGSYDKIMIGDIIISLARGRKDKVNGTGRLHIMKNRYGMDGLTYSVRVNTANGHFEVNDTIEDDDEPTQPTQNNNSFNQIDSFDKKHLAQKFFELTPNI